MDQPERNVIIPAPYVALAAHDDPSLFQIKGPADVTRKATAVQRHAPTALCADLVGGKCCFHVVCKLRSEFSCSPP